MTKTSYAELKSISNSAERSRENFDFEKFCARVCHVHVPRLWFFIYIHVWLTEVILGREDRGLAEGSLERMGDGLAEGLLGGVYKVEKPILVHLSPVELWDGHGDWS